MVINVNDLNKYDLKVLYEGIDITHNVLYANGDLKLAIIYARNADGERLHRSKGYSDGSRIDFPWTVKYEGLVTIHLDGMPIKEVLISEHHPSTSTQKEEKHRNTDDIRPDYYNKGIEVVKFIQSWNLDFCTGNVVKYVTRAPYKGNRLQDLLKAKTYLGFLIQQAKEEEANAEKR